MVQAVAKNWRSQSIGTILALLPGNSKWEMPTTKGGGAPQKRKGCGAHLLAIRTVSRRAPFWHEFLERKWHSGLVLA